MRIYITGISGFLSINLVRYLLSTAIQTSPASTWSISPILKKIRSISPREISVTAIRSGNPCAARISSSTLPPLSRYIPPRRSTPQTWKAPATSSSKPKNMASNAPSISHPPLFTASPITIRCSRPTRSVASVLMGKPKSRRKRFASKSGQRECVSHLETKILCRTRTAGCICDLLRMGK